MPRWRLFKIGGHTVHMEPLFLLLVAFFMFGNLRDQSQLATQMLWGPILFIGILWHELGHAFANKFYGYGNSTIVLQGLGGVTINNNRGQSPPGKSILISLAGPIFSGSLVLIFGLAAFFYPGDDLLNTFFSMMALINGVWAIFNLLPIAPLDGGHIVLHGLRWKYDNPRKALLHSAYSSLFFLVPVTLLGMLVLSPFWTILLGVLFGMHNVRVIQQLKSSGY